MRTFLAGTFALGIASCSANKTEVNSRVLSDLKSCAQQDMPLYYQSFPVAQYADNFEGNITYDVRFYNSALRNLKFNLTTEENILDFYLSDLYRVVEIAIGGSKFPSAVIFRGTEHTPTLIRYYSVDDSSQKVMCAGEIQHSGWNPIYVTQAGSQILKNFKN